MLSDTPFLFFFFLRSFSDRYETHVVHGLDDHKQQWLSGHRHHLDDLPNKAWSPLAMAIKAGKAEVVRVLINNDANPREEDGTGRTPYDRALYRHWKLQDALRRTKEDIEKEQKDYKERGDSQSGIMMKEREEKFKQLKGRLETSNDMMRALRDVGKVKKYRRLAAFRQFGAKAFFPLLLQALFIFVFTPISPGYQQRDLYDMASSIKGSVSSYTSDIQSAETWASWHKTFFTSNIEHSKQGGATYMTENIVLGSVKIERIEARANAACTIDWGSGVTINPNPSPCFPERTPSRLQDSLKVVPQTKNNEMVTNIYLDLSNTTKAAKQLTDWVNAAPLSETTIGINTFVNFYNPTLKIFTMVQATTNFPVSGSVGTSVSCFAQPITIFTFPGLFPPSLGFEIAVIFMVVLRIQLL